MLILVAEPVEDYGDDPLVVWSVDEDGRVVRLSVDMCRPKELVGLKVVTFSAAKDRVEKIQREAFMKKAQMKLPLEG